MDNAQNTQPNAQDFTYPDMNAGAAVTPTPATTPVDPAIAGATTTPPATVTPPPASPKPKADANRGQVVSGPSFDDSSTPPVTEPAKEPQIPMGLQPDPTRPVAAAPEEVKQEKKKEKKINPLKALADKLNALKTELVEEVPADEGKKESKDPVVKSEDAPPEVPETPEQKLPDLPVPEVKTPDMPVPVVPEIPALPGKLDDATEFKTNEIPNPKPDAKIPATPAMAALDDDIVKDDLSSIMPERPSTDELVLDKDDVTEVSEVIPSATEGAKADAPDMTQTGPDAIQKEVPATAEVKESSAGVKAAKAVVKEQKSKGYKPGKYPYSIIQILDMAIQRDASDVQISVGYPVMIRIDGTMIAISDDIVTPTNSEELILPVLSEQKKELLEVNREVDLAYAHQTNVNARFRINAYYSRENLAAAFRLIPSNIRTIDELNLPPMYKQLSQLNQGLVLITGPTGHGKSTTLAAIIQEINMTRSEHVITIEDPIEYIFPKSKAIIDQREMHDDTHSWTIALKSALRQDPDVILVGEMRDYETIASTITLAETGHLVFATLHTNSAAQTIDRIIDVFPENQQAQIRTQLANILEAVIAQRLIPLDEGGRRAVSEIMIGTPAVRNLIREGKTHQLDNVIRTSADVGMVSLESSLVKLVRDGKITMDRAQEFAVHPEEVIRLLKN